MWLNYTRRTRASRFITTSLINGMMTDYQDVNVPEISMADCVFQQLKLFAAEKHKIAQIFADDGSSWTFEKLFQSSVHVAAGLKSVGINPGDMVSIVARNSHELYALVLGCVMSDVVVTPSIPELSPNELKQNFVLVEPKFVIAWASSLPAVKDAVASLSPKPQVFEVQQLYRDTVSKGSVIDPATFKPAHINDPTSHVFSCMFSSGTTGRQKAVAMTDFGMIRISVLSTPKTDGPIFNSSQMNWVSWWSTAVRCLFKGWIRIFMDKTSVVDILNGIHTFKPSYIAASPIVAASMAHEMAKRPGHWDLSSLRAFVAGGDIFGQRAQEELSKKIGINIYQSYGSTEAGAILVHDINSPVVYGSSGKAVVPIRLVDLTTGKDITEAYKPGEIRVKLLVFSHYANNPKETAESFDEKGWFKTGDIAHFDEGGHYFIVGRVKEMFKYRANQIAPGELEDIIKKMPGVKDAVVVGKPAGLEIGCLPTAFIIKTADSKITERDVHDYLDKCNLHDSKRLRGGVLFTNEIPCNVNGKILRVSLLDLLN